MKQYAQLAAWIYDPLDYTCPVGQLVRLNRRKNLAIVYDGNQIYFICRGTRTKKDIMTDVALGFGFIEWTNRFAKLEQWLKPYLPQKQNVILIGHSLGGTLATEMGLKYGIESHTFNSGKSPFTRLSPGLRHKRSREYRNAFDIVSLFGALEPHVRTKRLTAGHSIATFT